MKESMLYFHRELFKEMNKNMAFGNEDKKYVLNPTQMRIIELLINNNYQINQKVLEQKLNLSRATVSDVLKRMENKKIITRKVSDTDLRSKLIILSEDAKKIYEQGNKKMMKLNDVAIKDISKKDMKTYVAVTNKMIENLRNYRKDSK